MIDCDPTRQHDDAREVLRRHAMRQGRRWAVVVLVLPAALHDWTARASRLYRP